MRFASIVGARPQFIKLAPVSRALRRHHEELIIHTGQHYDVALSEQFFEEYAIPKPDYHLGIGSASHGAQTGRMLEAVEEVLLKERPDGVIVFGDTNSTLAGALAAAKLHIPVAHVEAGLRSFNREMPEEINRVLTDHLSTWLFCPTETACRHLAHEGITAGVEQVGDVMYDVLKQVQPSLSERAHSLLSRLGIAPQTYLLLTIHRPVNTDDPARLRQIARAISDLGKPVIFPVHPRTQKFMQEYDLTWNTKVHLIEPLGHLDMLALVQAAYRVATDSGGLQKEAFLLGTPCVTLREETEWPETLEGGWNILVGSRPEAITEALSRPQPEPLHQNPFGEGDAALRIASLLLGKN
ncbi:MAG TPA: UDP-N-acetylglucosamine 2-epimerase (non-hydrolyzing) [Ktedonobacterales bacterium]|nr:UDP-N-acetylglucosamine 2-epimerase (non-hydrolyzing) [Ktedonobacterales bacterium]